MIKYLLLSLFSVTSIAAQAQVMTGGTKVSNNVNGENSNSIRYQNMRMAQNVNANSIAELNQKLATDLQETKKSLGDVRDDLVLITQVLNKMIEKSAADKEDLQREISGLKARIMLETAYVGMVAANNPQALGAAVKKYELNMADYANDIESKNSWDEYSAEVLKAQKEAERLVKDLL